MQRRVPPVQPLLVRQLLQLLQILLGDLPASLLVGRVTIVNPATERPVLAGGAEVLLLERAEVGGDRRFIWRRSAQEHVGFKIADEQRMAVLLEPAAAAAGHAHGAGGGDLAIGLGIDAENFPAGGFVQGQHGSFLPHSRLQSGKLQVSDNVVMRDQVSLAGAGAFALGPLPVLGRGDVAFPEGPAPALPRPDRVDRAAFFPVVHHAVAVRLLAEAPAIPYPANMNLGELFHRLPAIRGDLPNLLVVDPDIARRPGAAVAALRAAEAEAVLVPGFGHGVDLSCCKREGKRFLPLPFGRR